LLLHCKCASGRALEATDPLLNGERRRLLTIEGLRDNRLTKDVSELRGMRRRTVQKWKGVIGG
jgi:hypothetical protein